MNLVMLAAALCAPLAAYAGDDAEPLNWDSLSTASWGECASACARQQMGAARSSVLFHTPYALTEDEAKALANAIGRGLKVEFFVGERNALFDEIDGYASDIFEKWAATADASDTSMVGMGGCVMGADRLPQFVVTDPYQGAGGKKHAALIVNDKISHDPAKVAAAAEATQTEDFIQCRLQ